MGDTGQGGMKELQRKAAASPFDIPELFTLIVAHLDPDSLFRAVQVCRLWYQTCIPKLWCKPRFRISKTNNNNNLHGGSSGHNRNYNNNNIIPDPWKQTNRSSSSGGQPPLQQQKQQTWVHDAGFRKGFKRHGHLIQDLSLVNRVNEIQDGDLELIAGYCIGLKVLDLSNTNLTLETLQVLIHGDPYKTSTSSATNYVGGNGLLEGTRRTRDVIDEDEDDEDSSEMVRQKMEQAKQDQETKKMQSGFVVTETELDTAGGGTTTGGEEESMYESMDYDYTEPEEEMMQHQPRHGSKNRHHDHDPTDDNTQLLYPNLTLNFANEQGVSSTLPRPSLPPSLSDISLSGTLAAITTTAAPGTITTRSPAAIQAPKFKGRRLLFPSKLSDLFLNDCPYLDGTCLFLIQQLGPQLERLGIDGIVDTDDQDLNYIVQSCPNLKALGLGGTEITDLTLERISDRYRHSLDTLDLNFVRQGAVTDLGLMAVVGKCRKLKDLSCYGNTTITDKFIIPLLVAQKGQFHSSSTSASTVTATAGRNDSIMELDTDKATVVEEQGRQEAKTLMSRVCQYLLDLPQDSVGGILEHYLVHQGHGPLRNMTPTGFSANSFIAGSTVAATPSSSNNNEEQEQHQPQQHQQEPQNFGPLQMPTLGNTVLTGINLSNCQGISAMGLKTLFKFATELILIDVEDTAVDDAALEILAETYRNRLIQMGMPLPIEWTSSEIDGCTVESQKLVDQPIPEEQLVVGGLKQLVLSACQEVTDQGLKSILRSCSGLRHLDVSYCQNVTLGIFSLPHPEDDELDAATAMVTDDDNEEEEVEDDTQTRKNGIDSEGKEMEDEEEEEVVKKKDPVGLWACRFGLTELNISGMQSAHHYFSRSLQTAVRHETAHHGTISLDDYLAAQQNGGLGAVAATTGTGGVGSSLPPFMISSSEAEDDTSDDDESDDGSEEESYSGSEDDNDDDDDEEGDEDEGQEMEEQVTFDQQPSPPSTTPHSHQHHHHAQQQRSHGHSTRTLLTPRQEKIRIRLLEQEMSDFYRQLTDCKSLEIFLMAQFGGKLSDPGFKQLCCLSPLNDHPFRTRVMTAYSSSGSVDTTTTTAVDPKGKGKANGNVDEVPKNTHLWLGGRLLHWNLSGLEHGLTEQNLIWIGETFGGKPRFPSTTTTSTKKSRSNSKTIVNNNNNNNNNNNGSLGKVGKETIGTRFYEKRPTRRLVLNRASFRRGLALQQAETVSTENTGSSSTGGGGSSSLDKPIPISTPETLAATMDWLEYESGIELVEVAPLDDEYDSMDEDEDDDDEEESSEEGSDNDDVDDQDGDEGEDDNGADSADNDDNDHNDDEDERDPRTNHRNGGSSHKRKNSKSSEGRHGRSSSSGGSRHKAPTYKIFHGI